MAYTLQQARVLNGMSRREAADKIGVSSNTIMNWEKGITYPNYYYIPKIVEAYKLESVDDIQFFCN